ncbi:hypothetical protein DER46DRAFT_693406 [Fusarium sp. MPI-SDFR-AT-0072]|nr:hypothetical protein DER46DRAFT_693406 [Fusarium sp. MPI-SDFR-AT-0072]KAI7759342.1 hypothetical protein LZL87_008719 [Fusarium oxysporum]
MKKKQPALEVRVDKEFTLTIEEIGPKIQISANRHPVVKVSTKTPTSVRKRSSIFKMLHHVLVAIRAWYLEFRGLPRSELALDEEKQGLL